MKSLTMHLKVEEDEQLREYVKELIQNQMLSITREDLRAMMKDIIDSKREQFQKTVDRFDFHAHMKNIIKEMIESQFKYMKHSDNDMSKITKQVIADFLTNSKTFQAYLVEKAQDEIRYQLRSMDMIDKVMKLIPKEEKPNAQPEESV